MKTSLLALLLLTGCATATWTDTTNTTRPAGPPEITDTTQPLVGEWLEMVTDAEEDRFEIREMVQTDEDGTIRVSLLPVALQALAYGGDVVMRFYNEDIEEVHVSTLAHDDAYSVIEEWRVQVRLGAKVELRRNAVRLLDRMIASRAFEATGLDETLRELRRATEILPDWR